MCALAVFEGVVHSRVCGDVVVGGAAVAQSVEQLAALGLEQLKVELTARGIKCGYERLIFVYSPSRLSTERCFRHVSWVIRSCRLVGDAVFCRSGTLDERAQRLFSLKTVKSQTDVPLKLRAANFPAQWP